MLISISGPQGCGKTTVLDRLKALGYEVVERKTARSVLADWNMSLDQIYSDRQLHMKFQDALLERKKNDEQPYVDTNTVCFTERSFVDTFVYSSQNLSRYNECSDWLDQYFITCSQYQKYYHKVIYIEGGKFPIENDGTRGVNHHYNIMIDQMLQYYLPLVSPSLQRIHCGDLEERISNIISNL